MCHGRREQENGLQNNLGKKYREWGEKGSPVAVNPYDFRTAAEGVANTHGIYDMASETGLINVDIITKDTAEFAVQGIRKRSLEHFIRSGYPSPHARVHPLNDVFYPDA